VSLRAFLHRAWIWGPVVAYLAVIFYFSSQSQVGWAREYPDKALHAIEYMGLALLFARALNGGLAMPVPARYLVLAWVLCLAYAASDEFHQAFVPGRTSDWRDAAADCAGAAVGLAAVAAAAPLLRRGRSA
jgi:VanZ family protein